MDSRVITPGSELAASPRLPSQHHLGGGAGDEEGFSAWGVQPWGGRGMGEAETEVNGLARGSPPASG